MKLLLKMLLLLLLLLTCNHIWSIVGVSLRFVPEEEALEPCEDMPGTNGIHDILDLSNFSYIYENDQLQISGSVKVVWDIEETDRIKHYGEILRYQRNSWRSTALTVISNDFCKDMFNQNSIWFDIMSSHIRKEDRHCIKKDIVYNIEPFAANITFSGLNLNLLGPVKYRTTFTAYDKMGKNKPNVVCYGIVGEVMKV